MITKRDEEILNHMKTVINQSHIDIIEYMNEHFTQEERDKHCVNIIYWYRRLGRPLFL